MNEIRGLGKADCGCCEGITTETPAPIYNRPGLPAIAYRVGTHAQFKASMLAALSLSDAPGLRALRTRQDDDLSIGLLDAWAMVADVLTFYEERIANESYIRTATERTSILHLARAVGYELRPGAAAAGYLAFSVEDAPGAPDRAIVDIRTKVQSVPGPGQNPQTFETVEGIEARARWNAMKPRSQWSQPVSLDMPKVFLDGTATNLKAGDVLLVVADSAGTQTALVRVTAVTPNSVRQQTRVDLQPFSSPAAPAIPALAPAAIAPAALAPVGGPLSSATVAYVVSRSPWDQGALQAYARVQGWSIEDLFAAIAARASVTAAPDASPGGSGIFALRVRASLFGYNAPDWTAMPPDTVQQAYIARANVPNAHYTDWPPWPYVLPLANQLDLDAVYPKVLPSSWIAITRQDLANGSPVITHVQAVTETADANYTLSSKMTRVALDATTPAGVVPQSMADLRQTTVYAQSEWLPPAALPHPPSQTSDEAPPVENGTIELDGLYAGLSVGQPIAVSGERYDLAGVQASETAVIQAISHEITASGGWTTLTLTANLLYQYRRDTATLNANLAWSTHGETVSHEVLGSGDGSRAFQAFTLHQSPLTYVHAQDGAGAQSTLHVSVEDLPWNEVAALTGHGPHDRVYVTRATDDGKTVVQFGDGETGARPPTGQENIQATYRRGIGHEGLLEAGKLTLLMSRPLGIKSVTNPQATSGADDGEDVAAGRDNAALTVLTMNRIVSLQDYEDFARAYAGIAKAHASWAWDGEHRRIIVTVAAPNGAPIAVNGPLLQSLKTAMLGAGDPYAHLDILPCRQMLFGLSSSVLLDGSYVAADVRAAIESALRSTFSFDARSFEQAVSLSEVSAVIQQVRGVRGVDVTALYFHGDPAVSNPILVPPPPYPTTGRTLAPAAVLSLDPGPLELVLVTQ